MLPTFHLFATSCQPANISASIVVDCSVFVNSMERKIEMKKKESLEFSQRFEVFFFSSYSS